MRPLLDRFWDQVDPGSPAECWLWKGRPNVQGYGQISKGGRGNGMIKAHRLSYALHYGELPEDLMIRHLCGERMCVNPSHLASGTAADNARDTVLHGRSTKGSINPNSVLDEYDVAYIKYMIEVLGLSNSQIAREYSVSDASVSMIRHGHTWTHVQPAF